jgi:hypothetical protein
LPDLSPKSSGLLFDCANQGTIRQITTVFRLRCGLLPVLNALARRMFRPVAFSTAATLTDCIPLTRRLRGLVVGTGGFCACHRSRIPLLSP